MSDTRQQPRHPRRTPVLALLSVAAAVIAVAVVAYLLTRNPSQGTAQTSATPSTTVTPGTPTSASPTTTSPTTSTTSTTSTTAAATTPTEIGALKVVTIVTKELPTGPAPGVAYFVNPGTTPHTAYIHPPNDGPAIPVHLDYAEGVRAFTPFRKGYLLVFTTADSEEIRYYTSTGTMVQMAPLQSPWTKGLARGYDGSVAVSLSPGEVTEFDPSGKESQSWTIPSAHVIAPQGVLPDHTVLVMAWTGHGTTKLRLEPNGTVTAWTTLDKKAVDVSPVNGDLSISAKKVPGGVGDRSLLPLCSALTDVPGSSATLVDPSTSQPLWVDCGYHPGYFSPDGKAIAATTLENWPGGSAPYGLASPDSGVLGIIDASTGTVLVRFMESGPDSGYGARSRDIVWEDDTHVLVFEYGRGADEVIRLGLDGSVELAAIAPKRSALVVPEQQPALHPHFF